MAELYQVDQLVIRYDLWPRGEPDNTVVQRYADDWEKLPPIEVNQHREVVDGVLTVLAYKIKGVSQIAGEAVTTKGDLDFRAQACRANSRHGKQLTRDEKKTQAIVLYDHGKGLSKAEIADILSVSDRTVRTYLADPDKFIREEQNRTIRDLYLACYSEQDIALQIGVSQKTVSDRLPGLVDLERLPKLQRQQALYEELEWDPKVFDTWGFAKCSNDVDHFGATEQAIVDNLLYKYAQPHEIIVDPFGGGGSTIDVCKKRFRKYLVSDRNQHPLRPTMRQHDVTTGVLAPANWGNVSLVYLDPPYWRQAKGQYSQDPTDLGNMELDEFNQMLSSLINGYAAKLRPGARIALIIMPTQLHTDGRGIVYHDLDMIRLASEKLELEYHIFAPLGRQEYAAHQVAEAKKQKEWLVDSRRLVIWKVKENAAGHKAATGSTNQYKKEIKTDAV